MNGKVYRADPHDPDAVAKALLAKYHDQELVAEIRHKPVKLQVNNSGAWKDVVRFDAANESNEQAFLDAVHALGMTHTGRVTFRIASDEPLPFVLMNWSKADGWKKAEGHS